MSNQLTEDGIRVVKIALKHTAENVNIAQRRLVDAEKHFVWMQTVNSCDHELETLGGIELVQIKCKKCGFSWFD